MTTSLYRIMIISSVHEEHYINILFANRYSWNSNICIFYAFQNNNYKKYMYSRDYLWISKVICKESHFSQTQTEIRIPYNFIHSLKNHYFCAEEIDKKIIDTVILLLFFLWTFFEHFYHFFFQGHCKSIVLKLLNTISNTEDFPMGQCHQGEGILIIVEDLSSNRLVSGFQIDYGRWFTTCGSHNFKRRVVKHNIIFERVYTHEYNVSFTFIFVKYTENRILNWNASNFIRNSIENIFNLYSFRPCKKNITKYIFRLSVLHVVNWKINYYCFLY